MEDLTNYKDLTAPCGRDCFNCPFYLSRENEKMQHILAVKYGMKKEEVSCDGCRAIQGKCNFLKHLGFSEQCKIYSCSERNQVEFCYECNDFPCDLLQSLADRADAFPHNLKVFNLCLIKRIGVNEWVEKKSRQTFERYYKGKLDL